MKRKTTQPLKIGLALSGGGPLGAIYEIGALCALPETLNGIDFTKLDHYVGVSAGGFIVAGLANGMTPRELCASVIESNNESSETFDPSWLLSPAYGEFARRAIMLPSLLMSAAWHLTAGRKSLVHALQRLGPALPTGLFSNNQIDVELSRLLSRGGRTNDFRQLKTQLTLVATNLDSGEAAPFGRPGWDHVPISKAVQASSALPGLFPPVEIDDLYYVDGALKKKRRDLAEHAYQQTRQMLRSQKIGLSAKLWRHGISLRHDVLDDPKRHLSALPKPATQLGRSIAALQEIMDDLGHVVRSVAHQSRPSW